MINREKVIDGLECCTKKVCVCIYKDTEKKCPYWELCGEYEDSFEDCTTALSKDALALLKAQEPKPVHVTADINSRKIGECPNCGKWINSGDYPNYCGQCGQAVKWE